MGGFFTKMVFLVLLLHLLVSSSCAVKPNENGVCVSPYALQGKYPKSADRELKDLNLCKWNTFCAASQMHSASYLATYIEASKDCLELFELLECSICHPNVGIQSEHPPICASFCDRVFEACSDASFLFCDRFFEACSDAYFCSNVTTNVIIPCGSSENIICGKASKWESDGTAFCEAVGFTVQTADGSVEEPCYGSKASLEPMMELESGSGPVWFQDLQKQVKEMTLVQIISWVVLIVGLVGMPFYRWRINQQRVAMIQMYARRLGENYMNGNA